MTIGEKYIPTQDKVVWYSDDGTMLYGWQNIDGKVHYFDKITGKMTAGQKNIDGHWYLFDSKGVMQQGFQNIGYQNKTVYYNEDGWMLYGWQNKTVYYNKDGWMLYGHQLINGKKYYFNTITGAKE